MELLPQLLRVRTIGLSDDQGFDVAAIDNCMRVKSDVAVGSKGLSILTSLHSDWYCIASGTSRGRRSDGGPS